MQWSRADRGMGGRGGGAASSEGMMKLEQFEIASLSNLTPATAQEAKALIPSLGARLSDDQIEEIIVKLDNLSGQLEMT